MTSVAAPVTGWFRRIVCAVATRVFGDRALKQVRSRPWGGLSLGIAIFSFCADFATYFVENAVFALFAISVIAFIAFAAAAYRVTASIAPSIVSFIGVVVFGLMLLAQAAVGSAHGAIGGSVPLVADWQDAIARQLDRIEGDVAVVRETTGRTETKVDELSAEVQQLVAMIEAKEREAAADAGVSEGVLIALAQRINAEVSDAEQAQRELDYAVSIAIEVAEKGRAPDPEAIVGEAQERIAALSGEGKFEAAAAAADEAFAEWQAAEAARQDEATEQGVALLRAGLNQDLLRRDAKSAAQRISMMIALEHPDPEEAFVAMRQSWHDWLVGGADLGLVLHYEVAIELGRLNLERATTVYDRANAHGDLAVALGGFGIKSDRVAHLNEAAEHYLAILAEVPQEASPTNWAITQSNLGNTYATLGTFETGTEQFDKAIAAFEAALTVVDREADPGTWQMVQESLANGLRDLGARTGDASKIRDALDILDMLIVAKPRDAAFEEWTWTQVNRANTLVALGRVNGTGVGEAEEAVAVLTDALAGIRRTTDPMLWAALQTGLGKAETLLGELGGDVAHLDAAIVALTAAMEERPRDDDPISWATLQEHLARAYLAQFRNGDAAALTKAREAMANAIEEYKAVNHAGALADAEPLRQAIEAAG